MSLDLMFITDQLSYKVSFSKEKIHKFQLLHLSVFRYIYNSSKGDQYSVKMATTKSNKIII